MDSTEILLCAVEVSYLGNYMQHWWSQQAYKLGERKCIIYINFFFPLWLPSNLLSSEISPREGRLVFRLGKGFTLADQSST